MFGFKLPKWFSKPVKSVESGITMPIPKALPVIAVVTDPVWSSDISPDDTDDTIKTTEIVLSVRSSGDNIRIEWTIGDTSKVAIVESGYLSASTIRTGLQSPNGLRLPIGAYDIRIQLNDRRCTMQTFLTELATDGVISQDRLNSGIVRKCSDVTLAY